MVPAVVSVSAEARRQQEEEEVSVCRSTVRSLKGSLGASENGGRQPRESREILRRGRGGLELFAYNAVCAEGELSVKMLTCLSCCTKSYKAFSDMSLDRHCTCLQI